MMNSAYGYGLRSILGSVLVVAVAAAGCSDSNDTAAALKVSQLSPADGASAVPQNATIAVTFSDTMNASTVTTATVKVTAAGKAVAGAVTTIGRSVTFKPSSTLVAKTKHTVTVDAKVASRAGKALGATYTFSFTTGNGSDVVAPKVTGTSPANNGTNAAPGQVITATFSETVTGVSATTFIVKDGPAVVAGAVSMNGTTATFSPSKPLSLSSLYTAELTTGIKDVAGNALAAAHRWSFTTSAATDSTAPTLKSSSPKDNATDVDVLSPITASFSEGIAKASANSSTVTVSVGATGVPGAISVLGGTVTFTPKTSLAKTKKHTVRIEGIADFAGNKLKTPAIWSFTTKGDATLPTVTKTVPDGGTTSVNPLSPVTVVFSEPMDASTISRATFYLKVGATFTAGTVSYDAATKTAKFQPAGRLSHSTIHAVTLTTGVKDAAGNAIAKARTWSFTTARAPGGGW